MRLSRIRVEHLRGVAAREVLLDEAGVTVLLGPNEIGKSSLTDAIDVLFDELHTTTKQAVRDLQPVGCDVGTTVEVDGQLAGQRFTYRKTFTRDREAVLTLHGPGGGHWTGREAHDRMTDLLDEHLDVALWRALRLGQGDTLGQADLTDASSLTAALDRAAATALPSSAPADREDETGSLFAAAVAEHQRWFTPTGRDGAPLRDADAAVDAAQQEHDRLAEALAALEQEVDEHQQLEQRVSDLRARCRQATEHAAQQQQAWQQIAGVARAVDEADARLAQAIQRRDAAAQRQAARGQLIEDVAAAGQRRDQTAAALDTAEQRLQAAAGPADALEEAARAATQRQRAAATALRQAQAAREAAAAAQALDTLRRRHAAARSAADRVLQLERQVAGHRVDDDVLGDLRQAATEVATADAALRASVPAVAVEATAPVEVQVGEDPAASMEPGALLELAGDGTLRVRIGDLAVVTIAAGGDVAARRDDLAAARARLQEALVEADVEDLDAAAAAAAARSADVAQLEGARAEAAACGDPQILAAEVARAEGRLTGDGEREDQDDRDSSSPAVDAAAELDVERLAADLREAELAVERAGARAQDAQRQLAALREARAEAVVAAQAARDELDRLALRLAADRQHADDDQLAAAVADAEREIRAAEADLESGRARLDGTDPQLLETTAANAADARDDLACRLQDAERDLERLGARLEVQGGHGLGEQLAQAEAALVRARQHRTAARRRAAAAARLLEALTTCRDAVRIRHLAPLQEQLTRLARVLFGAQVQIEVDPTTLAITRLVRDGEGLPVAQLSVGTREQLAVLQRVAVALLVSRDGSGVPLVLDDVMGFADPQRLAAMGAVLRIAGEHTQVLLLTADPDRVRHVGGAAVVDLAALPAPQDTAAQRRLRTA